LSFIQKKVIDHSACSGEGSVDCFDNFSKRVSPLVFTFRKT
jgi:hypothetical protein